MRTQHKFLRIFLSSKHEELRQHHHHAKHDFAKTFVRATRHPTAFLCASPKTKERTRKIDSLTHSSTLRGGSSAHKPLVQQLQPPTRWDDSTLSSKSEGPERARKKLPLLLNHNRFSFYFSPLALTAAHYLTIGTSQPLRLTLQPTAGICWHHEKPWRFSSYGQIGPEVERGADLLPHRRVARSR